MTDPKRTEELDERDLDQVQGGTTKNLVGDEIGTLRGGKFERPDPKQMERAFDEDE